MKLVGSTFSLGRLRTTTTATASTAPTTTAITDADVSSDADVVATTATTATTVTNVMIVIIASLTIVGFFPLDNEASFSTKVDIYIIYTSTILFTCFNY